MDNLTRAYYCQKDKPNKFLLMSQLFFNHKRNWVKMKSGLNWCRDKVVSLNRKLIILLIHWLIKIVRTRTCRDNRFRVTKIKIRIIKESTQPCHKIKLNLIKWINNSITVLIMELLDYLRTINKLRFKLQPDKIKLWKNRT